MWLLPSSVVRIAPLTSAPAAYSQGSGDVDQIADATAAATRASNPRVDAHSPAAAPVAATAIAPDELETRAPTRPGVDVDPTARPNANAPRNMARYIGYLHAGRSRGSAIELVVVGEKRAAGERALPWRMRNAAKTGGGKELARVAASQRLVRRVHENAEGENATHRCNGQVADGRQPIRGRLITAGGWWRRHNAIRPRLGVAGAGALLPSHIRFHHSRKRGHERIKRGQAMRICVGPRE